MLATLEAMNKREEVVRHVLETGDYYFGLLSSKVKLTKLGLYMLEIIETDTATAIVEGRGLQRLQNENEDLFSRPAPPSI